MEFLFIGLAVGAVVAYFIFARFNKECLQIYNR